MTAKLSQVRLCHLSSLAGKSTQPEQSEPKEAADATESLYPLHLIIALWLGPLRITENDFLKPQSDFP
jgi:hypothetical protein